MNCFSLTSFSLVLALGSTVSAQPVASTLLDQAGDFLIAGSAEHNICVAQSVKPSLSRGDSLEVSVVWQPQKNALLAIKLKEPTWAFAKESFKFTFTDTQVVTLDARKKSGKFHFDLVQTGLFDAVNENDQVVIEHARTSTEVNVNLKETDLLYQKLERCLKWLI